LGTTGLKVSRICLGMMSYGTSAWRDWVLNAKESEIFVKKAVDYGINFFDTADMYSNGVSEQVLGQTLKNISVPREDVVIASKVFFQIGLNDPNYKAPPLAFIHKGLSRRHIFEAVDASLHRLGTNYIDLYQIHRWDNDTPIEETLEALHDLVRSGRVHYIGCSSCYSWQFMKALKISEARGWTKFISMQNHYNLVYREEEREMMPLCVSENIGVIPWSPLARGFLCGNRKKEEHSQQETTRAKSDKFAHDMYYQECDWKIVDQVKLIAENKKVTPAQVSLSWLLGKPGVTSAIIGATKLSHLEDAVRSLSVKLTPEEVKQLETPYQPHRVLGNLS